MQRGMLKAFLQNRLPLWLRTLFRRKPTAETKSKSALQVSALATIEQIFKRPDSLPESYRRFFLPVPLEDKELLIGRDEQLENMEKAFRNWQDGHPTSVALIGPQGCGKTSMLNCFQQRQSQNTRILRCEMEERLWSEQLVFTFFCRLFQIDPSLDNVETLIARLLQAESQLIVIEGAHNLLLRVIGGRKAAETFMYVVLRTRQRHFWLLTCRRLPWNNMDRHFGVSRYFSHVMAVDSLSEDRLRVALKLRLEKCGLQVFFCLSKEEFEQQQKPEAKQQQKPEANEQGEREDAFYRVVFANSGRNFHAALYFLLLCSRYEENTQSLSLYPPDNLDMAFVKEMDHLHLLTLAELAGHGVLSTREHEQIFRTVGFQSRIVFEYLEQLNLVEPVVTKNNANEKAYDLSPLIHHAVTAALEQLNLLY